MYIKVSKKHIRICLLVCCLFLTSYLSAFNTGNIFSDMNIADVSSVGGQNDHFSMNGGTNIGSLDYLSAADISVHLSFFSGKQNRFQGKSNANILTAVIAAQLTGLIYSSRLSARICTPFNSISITTFLHKKDGMK